MENKRPRGKRPSWMTPWGLEGQGDVFTDHYWNEYPLPSFMFDKTTEEIKDTRESS